MSESFLIKNGTIVTVDQNDRILSGDLSIRDGRITGIGKTEQHDGKIIDATGCAVLPGFVQTHLHLCQTIFRGAADDLSLIDWLKKRVWPMEAAHNAASVSASAQLGIAELIKGGTTCGLTMETVQHTDEVFKAVDQSGFRAIVGKCMMDKGEDVPSQLHEQTARSIKESVELLERWHGAAGGRIGYCFAPRFAVSCTRELLSEVASLALNRGVMVHTHASENITECEMVQRETGLRNINYLDSVGLTGRHVTLAHCVHVDSNEIELLARTRTNVSHCPSSNLKLGSGLAPIAEMLEHGVSVSLGADGAACNNRLDMFTEIRTAALLQKVRKGPDVLTARRALRLATIDGARAIGLEQEIGSLEVGKRADVIIVSLEKLHSTPRPSDIVSAVVYSAQPADVDSVWIDGVQLLEDGRLLTLDEKTVLEAANRESELLVQRAGLI